MSRPADGPEDRGLQERCITFGSPQLIAGYQSYTRFSDPEVGGHHDGDDSRCPRHSAGRASASSVHGPAVAGRFARPLGRRYAGGRYDQLQAEKLHVVSSEKLHVIERFTRTGPESLKYEITIDDPGTWTKPWSLMIPLRHPESDLRVRLP